jgi:phage terminase large subunit
LETSRDYLVTTELLDFPISERFLKLPVERFLEVSGIVPIEPQVALINALNDPRHRFIVACLSRRTGKTFIANTVAFLKAMEPGTNVLIVSPNFSLTNISWNEQLKMLTEHNIEIVSKNKTEKEIHLENGSMLKFGSVSSVNSLVGRSYDLILFDEAALDGNGRDAFNIQLRPTLDKPNSKVIFISTPRGLNYFHEFYMRGFDKDTNNGKDKQFSKWISIHSTWHDNPRNNEEDIEEARSGMSRAEFKQEYEADFTTFEGQIYESFDEERHCLDTSTIDFRSDPYRYETLMGIDPGYKDATGGIILKYDTDLDRFYIVWDYEVNEKTTSKHAAAFNDAFEEYDVDMIFCDSAAAQFRQDMAVDYDLPSTKAKKSVLDGIAYCQSLVDNDQLYVDSRCKHVILMLTNYRWDPNEALVKPKPKHDAFSHVADALRYALYSYRR